MHRWDIDIISDLVMAATVMVMILVTLVSLGVERLFWEILSEALHDPVVWHCCLVIVMVLASALGLRLHLEDEVTGFSVGVVRVEDA